MLRMLTGLVSLAFFWRGVFPEIDRTEFFRLGDAMLKINVAQGELLARLAAAMAT